MNEGGVIRVGIADDSPTVCEMLSVLVRRAPGMTLCGVARDGVEAVELARREKPDLMLMDVVMPKLDGLGATAAIMAEAPTRVLLISSVSEATQTALSFQGIEAGALELIAKPDGRESAERFGERVLEAIRLMAEVPVVHRRRPVAIPLHLPRQRRRVVEAVGLVASTGGPPAIAALLSALEKSSSAAILIAQHMTPGFTEGFARWLGSVVHRKVEVARDGAPCEPGHVYVAPDKCHLEVDAGFRLVTPNGFPALPCPSGTRLLASLARAYGPRVAGVVMTGMGDDGASGLLEIKKAGGVTMAQDQASCVVFGMPHAAQAIGAADLLLPPPALASLLLDVLA
ncbi:MAG TPA: chemotaxis protein CheB [Myxococcaceae bacterium]|jgi:two-component system chemotaxis response regulator CheB